MSFVHHRQLGGGQPLVLIHGFCETHEIWDDLTPALARNFAVFTPDLPGFGQSQSLHKNFTIDDVADAMFKWLYSTIESPAVIIGHSLGGYVAMAMAVKNAAACAGVGLFHSTAAADSDEKKQNRNKSIEFVKTNGVKPFVDVFVPGLFHQKDNPKIARVHQIALGTPLNTLVGYSAAMRDRPSREEWLPSFRNNLLIVAGHHDSLIPIHLLKHQSTLVSKSSFFELLEVGHMGMFEAPESAIEAIRRFTFTCFEDVQR